MAATLLPLAADLGSNAILLLVFAVLFFGLVVGFFTYAGSGIGSRPLDRAQGAPGSRRPDDFQEFAGRQPLPRDLDEIAPGVWRVAGWPPSAFNVYLIAAGESAVLVDAGTRYAARRILRALHAHPFEALLLTNAQPDHQGAAAAVCTLRDIPLWCGAADADVVETGRADSLVPDHGWNRRLARAVGGPAHPVARRLREGDAVGPFVVLETPGVTPGHISLWRESDRVLIAGDVATGQHPVLGKPALHRQPDRNVLDPARNRESLRRLAELRAELILFGHGPPLRDPDGFAALVPGTTCP